MHTCDIDSIRALAPHQSTVMPPFTGHPFITKTCSSCKNRQKHTTVLFWYSGWTTLPVYHFSILELFHKQLERKQQLGKTTAWNYPFQYQTQTQSDGLVCFSCMACHKPRHGRVSYIWLGHVSWFSGTCVTTARERACRPHVSKLRPSKHSSWHELHGDHLVRWHSPDIRNRNYSQWAVA